MHTIWCCCCLQAVQAFVRQAMSYVDQTPDQETKVELIRTLQSVTEGKVSSHGCWPLFHAKEKQIYACWGSITS